MTIRQSVTLPGSPESIYRAPLSSRQFGDITGAAAEIAEFMGGEFSRFDNQISGLNIELEPYRRIVQAWRVSSWEEGVFSTVTFELEESSGSTSVQLEQTGYPVDARDHLDSGWHKMYWEPLRTYLSRSEQSGVNPALTRSRPAADSPETGSAR